MVVTDRFHCNGLTPTNHYRNCWWPRLLTHTFATWLWWVNVSLFNLWDHNFVTAKQVIELNLYDIYLMEIWAEIISIWWLHHDLMRIKRTYVTSTSISRDLIPCDVGYNFCKTVWPQPTFPANLWPLYTPIASPQNLSQKFHNIDFNIRIQTCMFYSTPYRYITGQVSIIHVCRDGLLLTTRRKSCKFHNSQ